MGWRGHAIEVRLCAEDPANDFLPQTGPVVAWRAPNGPGVRVDHGLASVDNVSPYYDSMQAKVIAYGADRETARRRLLKALDDTVFFGLPSNRDFLRVTLAHPAFASGEFDTGFIDAHLPEPAAALPAPDSRHQALAGALFHRDNARAFAARTGVNHELLNWHNSNPTPTLLSLRYGRDESKVRLHVHPQGAAEYRVRVVAEGEDEGVEHIIRLTPTAAPEDAHAVGFDCDGVPAAGLCARADDQLWLDVGGATVAYDDVSLAATETRGDAAGSGEVKAHSDGRILQVDVEAGQSVARGETLLVLEAMKMEFQVVAEIDGTVDDVLVAAGDQVAARQLLVAIVANAETDAKADG